MDYGVVNLTPLAGLFLTIKPEYYTKHKKNLYFTINK